MSFSNTINILLKSRLFLTILNLLMVVIILFFGLNPTTWPDKNTTQLLPNADGLHFHNPGFSYVDSLTSIQKEKVENGFSIVLKFSVGSIQNRGFKPLVVLHDGNDSTQLTISQWERSIIVMNGDDYTYSRREPRISADNFLEKDIPTCITITTGSAGTYLFSNGLTVQKSDKLHLTIPTDGEPLRLVLGNSAYGNHSWEGILYELALYDNQLPPERMHTRCAVAPDDTAIEADTKDTLLLHYAFKADSEDAMRDLSGNNASLRIPSRPLALKTSFLAVPWQGFILDQNLIVDIIINFLGFIPFGAALFARFRLSYADMNIRPIMVTGLLCFFLSLSIELLQGWLPYRTSSMLDLALNTTGGLVGALLFHFALSSAVKNILRPSKSA